MFSAKGIKAKLRQIEVFEAAGKALVQACKEFRDEVDTAVGGEKTVWP